MSVLRSKRMLTRSQQPGGSGITQSIPVLGSPDAGTCDRRARSTITAAYPRLRKVSSRLFCTQWVPAQLSKAIVTLLVYRDSLECGIQRAAMLMSVATGAQEVRTQVLPEDFRGFRQKAADAETAEAHFCWKVLCRSTSLRSGRAEGP